MRALGFLSLWFLSFSITTTLAQSTCSATSPCAQGCCSSSGNCGFGPDYCGTGCLGTCNAKAECGKYAPTGKSNCPLNVCCSYYGFCGTTTDFCATTGTKQCQNNCAAGKKSTCDAGSRIASKGVSVGYYESWAQSRTCDTMEPSAIQAAGWTHLNYAFALIDTATFKISQMNSFDVKNYVEFTGLKTNFPGLKTYIAVGGWAAGGKVFSDMVSTAVNRKAFIDSALAFVRTYAFDGIDIDWEYPGADDRGGKPADFANFVTFMKELRAAFGNLGVTATLPSSYWYLQGFDIKNLEPSVDWFNMMTYDIHGTWDGNNKFTSKTVAPHTNLTEIDAAMDLLWKNNISPSKVVLGLGFYGRAFTLASPSCNKPGCAFTGGAKPGECTGESGILSNNEIQRIIASKSLTPTLDRGAGIKYISWDSDQWVSYDDAETFQMKIAYANRLCLAGVMVWAIDLDTSGQSTFNMQDSGNLDGSTSPGMFFQKKTAITTQNKIQTMVFWTRCLKDNSADRHCPSGYHEIAVGHGRTFDGERQEVSSGCHGKENRVLCMHNMLIEDRCAWNRDGNGGKNCDSRCPDNTYFLSQNTHPGGDKTSCDHGKFISICCAGFTLAANTCPPSMIGSILAGGVGQLLSPAYILGLISKGKRDDIPFEENLSLDLKDLNIRNDVPLAQIDPAKIDKRSSSGGGCNNLNYPLNIGSGSIIVNSGMVWSPMAVNGIGSGGGSWFGVRGDINTITRPAVHVTEMRPITRTCDGSKYPQPCHHYSSVGRRNPLHQTIPCDRFLLDVDPAVEGLHRDRYPNSWNNERNAAWSQTWIQKSYIPPTGGAPIAVRCQRDEWPPYAIWRDRSFRGDRLGDIFGHNNVYIRLLPGGQNGGVLSGLSFTNICDPPAYVRSSTRTTTSRYIIGPLTNQYEQPFTTYTLNALVMSYTNMPQDINDPAFLTDNVCWPKALSNHGFEPGYALFNRDQYFRQTLTLPDWGGQYRFDPSSWDLRNAVAPTRRDLSDHPTFAEEDGVIVVHEINSTRLPTAEEMQTYLGYVKCETEDCAAELIENERRAADIQSAIVAETPVPRATAVEMVLTASNGDVKTEATATSLPKAPSKPTGSGQPVQTSIRSAPTGGNRMHQHMKKHGAH